MKGTKEPPSEAIPPLEWAGWAVWREAQAVRVRGLLLFRCSGGEWEELDREGGTGRECHWGGYHQVQQCNLDTEQGG